MNTEQTVSNVGVPSTRVLPAISWGAVFAGTLVAAGVWLLLHTLGTGVGLIAIDPAEPSSLRAVGIGTGLWTLIVPLLALFVGGLVAGRLAGPLSRLTGAIHGAVVWSLATVASLSLLWMLVTSVVGGAVMVSTEVASTTAGAAGPTIGGMGPETLASLGISTDDLLGPVNRRLEAAGKPPITAEQLTAAAGEALRVSAREGQLNRDMLIDALANNTALSRDDVAGIASTIQVRHDQRVGQLAELRRAAEQRALQAAENAGRALLGLFFTMLLGLGASVAGATLAVGHERKVVMRDPTRRLSREPLPAH